MDLQMRYFGNWDNRQPQGALFIPTPVGLTCTHCKEPIEMGDCGVRTVILGGHGRYAYEHRECFLRSVYGSVAHQRQCCSCYGGTEEDDPNLTTRQAALAAVAYAEKHGVAL